MLWTDWRHLFKKANRMYVASRWYHTAASTAFAVAASSFVAMWFARDEQWLGYVCVCILALGIGSAYAFTDRIARTAQTVSKEDLLEEMRLIQERQTPGGPPDEAWRTRQGKGANSATEHE